jgi:hypothetical protein
MVRSVAKKGFPKSAPNILGDSQSIGKISVNNQGEMNIQKIDETVASKGFR